MIFIIVIFIFILVVASCNNQTSLQNQSISDNISNPTEPITQATPTVTAAPTPTQEPYTSIIIGGSGDIIFHTSQLKDAQNRAEEDDEFTTNGDEAYSFYHWFDYIKPALQYPDLMIGNLETTIANENIEVSGFPRFATPKEILPTLKDVGFDVLTSGNNHILDKEQAGLISTVDALEEAQIYHTGAWTSLESKNTPLVIDVKGILVGVVSATISVNNQEYLLSDEENEYMYLSTNVEDVGVQINNCKKAGAEVIVVCVHWGLEGWPAPNSMMISHVKEYIKFGADIVFANHPHVLQPVDRIQVTLDSGETREGIAFWSLGNFISNQSGDEQQTSVVAYVTMQKNNLTGEITIASASYLPIWIHIDYNLPKTYSIIPAGQALDFPESIASLAAPSGLPYRLRDAWLIATTRLGSDDATPLRYVPNEQIYTGDWPTPAP